jgi:hypothetical protein
MGGCAAADDLAACAIPNSTLEARLVDRPLAPRTLIEARLNAAGRDEPLYRVNFTTSRFATFSHHIHSFAEAAWDHHRLLGEPANPLLNGDELARAGEIVAARRDSGTLDASVEASMFDEAWALFKLGHRPLPERMEILLLRDGSRSYALLLESPEPIEWARTTLTLRHAGSAAAGAFQERGFVALRNADQARMLIFLPESEQVPVGNLPEGIIRMEWRFLLDAGPAARLLTRGGSTDPENAAIEFSLPAFWP